MNSNSALENSNNCDSKKGLTTEVVKPSFLAPPDNVSTFPNLITTILTRVYEPSNLGDPEIRWIGECASLASLCEGRAQDSRSVVRFGDKHG